VVASNIAVYLVGYYARGKKEKGRSRKIPLGRRKHRSFGEGGTRLNNARPFGSYSLFEQEHGTGGEKEGQRLTRRLSTGSAGPRERAEKEKTRPATDLLTKR